MNFSILSCRFFRFARAATLLAAAAVCAVGRGDEVKLRLEINQANDPDGIVRYYVYPYLEASPAPLTQHTIKSANGRIQGVLGSDGYQHDVFGGAFFSIPELIDELTTNIWTMTLNSNDASQQVYRFTITITNLDTDTWPLVIINSPVNQSPAESSHPNYSWSGPTNWMELFVQERTSDFVYAYSADLDAAATNWSDAASLPIGSMAFEVDYSTTNTQMFQFSSPTNSVGTLANWTAEVKLRSYATHEFTVVGQPPAGHQLQAHYTFDDEDNLGEDVSGNGNQISDVSGCGGPGYEFSTDAVAGGGAIQFLGGDYPVTPTNLVATLAGSFSVSVWLKTSQTGANGDDANAYDGTGILWENGGGWNNIAIPLSITGNKAAFMTGNAGGPSDTLHSSSDIVTGEYVHIVVTRSQSSGEKKIYINGVLDTNSVGITALLDSYNGDFRIQLGAGYCPNVFDGLLDDLQIYSGVLSANEVADLYADPGTAAPDVEASGILAHYNFDDDMVIYPLNVSDNGYNMDYGFGYGSGIDDGAYGGTAFSLTAKAGTGALNFYKEPGNFYSGGEVGWYSTPTNIMSALAGTFSISLWVKTTNGTGNLGDPAVNGACIVAADVPGNGNDVVPVALTGGAVAFTTGGDDDNTLTSDALVNDDQWHHIVVTRNQETGQKRMFIDGIEDANSPASGSTNLLRDPNFLSIGVAMDASAPDPNSAAIYQSTSYEGLLDDLQFYSRAISDGEVQFLFTHPGEELAGSSVTIPLTLAEALDNTNFVWTTGGDAPWIPETTNTFDGQDAAQSGTIGDDQLSWVQTTAPANGHFYFNWKISSEDDADYLTVYINDGLYDFISGEQDWNSYDLPVSEGDVVRWEYSKNSSTSSGQNHAWLDHVQFTFDLATALNLEFHVDRGSDGSLNYYVVPKLPYFIPSPTTIIEVRSPNGMYVCDQFSSTSFGSASLADVIHECTVTNWALTFNKGDPQEQVYKFNVFITFLDTNLLSPVTIFSPTNGGIDIPTNPSFRWSGPSAYDPVLVSDYLLPTSTFVGNDSLPGTATNWSSAPALPNGTNQFYVTFINSSFGTVSASTPIDIYSHPITAWSSYGFLYSSASSIFVVGTPGVSPVQILGVQLMGGNFQFSFATQAGQTNAIEARTNLASGSWIELTNFIGDGSLKQFSFPATNPPIRFFRAKTQ